jgi:hypothetical protein
MKRLLILVLVIGTASVANATLALVAEVEGTPYDLSGSGEELAVGTTVHVAVVQSTGNPVGNGGEMTITMSASGGSATDTSPGLIWLSATEEISYCYWDWFFNGGVAFIDNGDGTWYAWFGKHAQMSSQHGMPGTPGLGDMCGSWMFPTPYASTMEFSFLATETTALVWSGTWDSVNMNGVVGGTVNVEPCACYGDVTGDDKVSIADLSAIVAWLIPYAGGINPYTICPPMQPPPAAGWECADVTGDGCISIADLSAIVASLAPAYAGTTPPYTRPCISSQ